MNIQPYPKDDLKFKVGDLIFCQIPFSVKTRNGAGLLRDIHRGDTFVLLEISSYYLNCANYYFFHPILGECKTFSSVKDMNARMCFASNGA
jgi:hypothetical protein